MTSQPGTEVQTEQTQQTNDLAIELQLTPEQHDRLKTWLKNKEFVEVATGPENQAYLINILALHRKNHPKEKEVLQGEMIDLRISLFSPYVEFLKDYLRFFGSKDQLEILCMKIIYQKAGDLHRELTQFAENKVHLLDDAEWYWKHSHVAMTDDQLEEQKDEKDS